jgi:hypothetical protein
MTKWKKDLEDVDAIYADITRFAGLTPHGLKTYVDDHPDDGLNWITLSTGGSLFMTSSTIWTSSSGEVARKRMFIHQPRRCFSRSLFLSGLRC